MCEINAYGTHAFMHVTWIGFLGCKQCVMLIWSKQIYLHKCWFKVFKIKMSRVLQKQCKNMWTQIVNSDQLIYILWHLISITSLIRNWKTAIVTTHILQPKSVGWMRCRGSVLWNHIRPHLLTHWIWLRVRWVSGLSGGLSNVFRSSKGVDET